MTNVKSQEINQSHRSEKQVDGSMENSARKEWHTPTLLKLAISATAIQHIIGNEGTGSGKGNAGDFNFSS